MLEKDSLAVLHDALNRLEAGFQDLPELETEVDLDKLKKVMNHVAKRMQENYPYFHPYYVGQMLKPPHPVARIAYMLAMWINPNNHALDGGIASSKMEKEVVQDLAAMFGWNTYLGHLTGGGTMANMEALWIAGQIHPGKKILASELAHYTHHRISGVLQLPFESVSCNRYGVMDIDALRRKLESNDVGTVVATIGTTGLGKVDPLEKILDLQAQYGFRIHADAAYGGYFVLADLLPEHVKKEYEYLSKVDSIVIDPHKHGLQPYGCGCIVFKDPVVGTYYQHDSPYTYFTTHELHLGEISLECSRAGASAVGLWATHQYFPLVKGGEFSQVLDKCLQAAQKFNEYLEDDPGFLTLYQPDLDIVVWGLKGYSLSEMSNKSRHLFNRAAEEGLHLALFNYPASLLPDTWNEVEKDADYVTCLRMVLIKPEHLDWVKRIFNELKVIAHDL